MSYGLPLVHTPVHAHGDRSHVSAAPWNVTGAHSPRAHFRPTSAAALCSFSEFFSHVRRGPGGCICHPEPDSSVSFHRDRWPAHSPPSLWDHYSASGGIRVARRDRGGSRRLVDFSQPADVDPFRRRRGSYAQRICALVEPEGRLLVPRGSGEYRRRYSFRGCASSRHLGRSIV